MSQHAADDDSASFSGPNRTDYLKPAGKAGAARQRRTDPGWGRRVHWRDWVGKINIGIQLLRDGVGGLDR